ncbi:hypothetical protein NHJ13734_000555 [Beauveria thailandica]
MARESSSKQKHRHRRGGSREQMLEEEQHRRRAWEAGYDQNRRIQSLGSQAYKKWVSPDNHVADAFRAKMILRVNKIADSSPTAATEKRQQRPNTNRFAPLATQNQDTDDALADAEVLIAEAQNQLDTRASVLRAYSQAIAKCAEQFSSGYGKRFAQHLRSTILQHWSAASYADVSSASDHAATSVEETPRTAPFATFAGVTRAANETQPGNRKITPKDTPRRKAQAPRNNKRALIRLRKDLEFFNKSLKV